jgi:uncharacterized protein YdeI (YjbR/CyaY-like superfamily)
VRAALTMAKSTEIEPGALPIKLFASARAWQRWLQAEHARSAGVWLKLAKRGHAAATVSYAEALEVALCFGWIDGDSRNRYAILYRIQDAKKPETRARRIAAFVEMLAQGKTLYP